MVTLTEEYFGSFDDKPVQKFTWRTTKGLTLSAISYGATLQSIKFAAKNGIVNDILLGFDDLQSYVTRNTGYFGATVGRCANRISKATFEIDGVTYCLAKNQGEDHLHGGVVGFDKKVWDTKIVGNKVIFSYLSKDGEEDYPGDLLTNLTYEVMEDNSFYMEYTATTTKKTVVNLTNHAYFNLAGHDTGATELREHYVTVNGDMITETDSDSIPTGSLLKVGGTPYDLRVPTKLSNLLRDNLFDDNYCITNFRAGLTSLQLLNRRRGDSTYFKMVTLTEEYFGSFDDKPVQKFTWRTTKGLTLSAISYGAILQSIKFAAKNGIVNDILLGFDDLQSYVTRNTGYFGATVGRCANRISKATFEIDGVTYCLAKNQGEDHLHGGVVGFDKKVWDTKIVGNKVIFSYLSKDGEEDYPGDLLTNLTYEVMEDNSFYMEYTATTTKKTVVNLTNHAYFNLAGHDTGATELREHYVTVNGDMITETDSDSIPTGSLLKVGGTPYDLRVPTKLSNLLRDNLFDDNYCITNFRAGELNFVSRVVHPQSGRSLEVYSDQPGVQLYTSNSLPSPSEAALVGKGGVGYRRHQAFCLETQTYPDAVNHANFPTSILTPGDIYKHRVLYIFGVEQNDNPVVIAA